MSSQNNNHKIPNWLQKIQDNSSELELLISGGAIFALLQLSNLLTNFISVLQTNLGVGGLNELLIGTQLILKILTVGFVFHLIMRGYWLSLVCLNYVFPNGIKWEKLNHKKPFNVKNDDRGDLYNEIIQADKFCGISMYMSVLCSVLIIGFVFGFVIVLILANFLGDNILTDILYFLFILFYADFFLSGFFRGVPYLSYAIFPFFYVFDLITLRFITQKSLFLFDTNNRILKFFFVLTFFLVGFFLSIEEVTEKFRFRSIIDKKKTSQLVEKIKYFDPIDALYDEGLYFEEIYYKDELSFPFYNMAVVLIEAKKIESNFLELEIVHNMILDKYCQKNDISALSNLFEIKINQSTYKNPQWHSWRQSKTHYSGIETMLDISNLNHGENMIEIYINDHLFAQNHFWFDKLKAQNTIK